MTLQELFSDPKRWCKRTYAKAKNGKPVEPDDPSAVRWCLIGGIDHCFPDRHVETVMRISAHIRTPVGQWNDAKERTIEDVQKLCKELNI